MSGKAQPAPERSTTTPAQQPTRWRRAFPYHWDVDDFVSRRQLLQWAVLTSGALWAGTAILAVLGWLDTRRRGTPQAIVRAQQVAEGEAFYFRYPELDAPAMLLHLPGGQFVAYSQQCTHLACGVYYQPERDRLYCPCHDGVFDPRTGEPLAGPPPRHLPRIVLRREGDLLMAVEEVP